MKRTDRATVAKNTLEIIERGGYLNQAGHWVDLQEPVLRCLEDTRLYLPDELRALRTPERTTSRGPEILIVAGTTLEVTQQFASESFKMAVLNFASARNAGGGFLNGSEAQEESLARSSALYVSQRRCPEFYEHHRAHADTLYSHRMIVSPHCPVFRNDDGQLLEAPYFPTFITSPAPNAGAVRNNQPNQVSEILPTLRERAALVFTLAAHIGVETLVLGAWGCGVFQNDPAQVATVFEELLVPGASAAATFKRVIFAIYDRSPQATILGAFRAHLNPLRPA